MCSAPLSDRTTSTLRSAVAVASNTSLTGACAPRVTTGWCSSSSSAPVILPSTTAWRRWTWSSCADR